MTKGAFPLVKTIRPVCFISAQFLNVPLFKISGRHLLGALNYMGVSFIDHIDGIEPFGEREKHAVEAGHGDRGWRCWFREERIASDAMHAMASLNERGGAYRLGDGEGHAAFGGHGVDLENLAFFVVDGVSMM